MGGEEWCREGCFAGVTSIHDAASPIARRPLALINGSYINLIPSSSTGLFIHFPFPLLFLLSPDFFSLDPLPSRFYFQFSFLLFLKLFSLYDLNVTLLRYFDFHFHINSDLFRWWRLRHESLPSIHCFHSFRLHIVFMPLLSSDHSLSFK